MPWFSRTDGHEGVNAAHVNCALGGVNDLIRDRANGTDDERCAFWCPDPAVSGDTEITEAQYDDFHDAMTIQNYEDVFIPQKVAAVGKEKLDEAALVKQTEEMAAARGLPPVLKEFGDKALASAKKCCEQGLLDTTRVLDGDTAELAQCKKDAATATRPVRVRRLRAAHRVQSDG